MKVLITGMVRDRAWIVVDYLKCLRSMDTEGLEVGYYFLVDPSTDGTEKIVWDTVVGKDIEKPLWGDACVELITGNVPADPQSGKERFESGVCYHLRELFEKMKRYAVENKYDYQLVVASDILVQSDTLQKLLSAKKDAVGPVTLTPGSRAAALVVRGKTGVPYSTGLRLGVVDYTGDVGLIRIDVPIGCFLLSKKAIKAGSCFVELDAGYRRILPADDVWLFLSLRQAGIEVWLDTSHVIPHYRSKELYERNVNKTDRKGTGVNSDIS